MIEKVLPQNPYAEIVGKVVDKASPELSEGQVRLALGLPITLPVEPRIASIDEARELHEHWVDEEHDGDVNWWPPGSWQGWNFGLITPRACRKPLMRSSIWTTISPRVF